MGWLMHDFGDKYVLLWALQVWQPQLSIFNWHSEEKEKLKLKSSPISLIGEPPSIIRIST